MKLAYLALASTLVSCMLYTMDTVDKKKRKKAIPATILIEQTVNKIPFKGKTKKLSEWIRQDGNRTFGKTRLFTLSKYGKLKQTATIKDIELAQIEDGLKIRSCVYVTNLEKVLLKNNRHLYLGALIMYKGNWPHAKSVSTIFEEYYRLNIPIQNRPKKLLVHTERPSMVEPLTLPKKPGSSTPRRKKSVIKKITD